LIAIACCEPLLTGFLLTAHLAALPRRHTNIIRMYGFCLAPPTQCLVMELLPSCLSQKLYGLSRVPCEHMEAARLSYGGPAAPAGSPAAFLLGGGGPSGLQSATSGASELSSSLGESRVLGRPGAVSTARGGSGAPEPLPPLEVLNLALGIAAGLAHLHGTPETRQMADAGGPDEDVIPDDDNVPSPLARVAHRGMGRARACVGV
jgi:hypothetical protein